MREHRADKQQDDVHALGRDGDPRGGVQSDEYRTADPREVVEEGDTVMAAPGGGPQEDTAPEERRPKTEAKRGYNAVALRGRLMVGRLTLDQVVKVRVLAPQPKKAPL